jgi:hypothetical protein
MSGGADTPDNLVVLCTLCHEEAPMTNDPEVMFRWLDARENYLVRALRLLEAELKVAGVDPAELVELTTPLRASGDFGKFLSDTAREMDSGVHFSRLNRGPVTTMSTASCGCGASCRQASNEACVPSMTSLTP